MGQHPVLQPLGPLLGGFVTDNFGWPWIFFLNVPLGLVSLFVCFRLLPPIKHPESGRNIDYVGAALFTAALVPILIGLSNKRTLDWPNYGLDYGELYRNLKFVGVLRPEVYSQA